MAPRERLVERGRVRVLPAVAGDRASARRRRHLAEVDDQHLARARRAARVARIPERAVLLLRQRPPGVRETPRAFRREGQHDIVELTHFWEEFYERMWELHRRIGGDIPGTFAELQRRRPHRDHHVRGHARVLAAALAATSRSTSSSARPWRRTAAFRPASARDLAAGVRVPAALRVDAAHRARAGKHRRMRPGIEEMLAAHGLEYFIADAPPGRRPARRSSSTATTCRSGRLSTRRRRRRAALGSAAPRTRPIGWPRAGARATRSRSSATPRRRSRCGAASTATPGTSPTSNSTRSTSRAGSVSGASPTRPTTSARSTSTTRAGRADGEAHARHFVELVRETLGRRQRRRPAVVCSPYDAELFGHWWFEGPHWLEQVRASFAAAGVTPGDARARRWKRCRPARRSPCRRARGARAAITACGSTPTPSGPGTACTARRPSGSSILRGPPDDRRAAAARAGPGHAAS